MKFPEKLMIILQDDGNETAIRWNHSGKSFSIRDRTRLCSEVLPRYFDSDKDFQYHSFARKLRRWNFIRTSRGLDTRIYSHPKFLRSKPSLCSQIGCIEEKKVAKKARNRSMNTTEIIRSDIKHTSTTRNNGVIFHEQQTYPMDNTHLSMNSDSGVDVAGSTSIMDKLRRDASILYNYSRIKSSLVHPKQIQASPAFTMNVVERAIITMNKCQRMGLSGGRISAISVPDEVMSNVMAARNA